MRVARGNLLNALHGTMFRRDRASPQLVPNVHKVVRTSDLHRIRNAHAALAEGLKVESEALVDLDQVTIAFKRQRQAGYGCSHAYLLTEMMALASYTIYLQMCVCVGAHANCLLTVSLDP